MISNNHCKCEIVLNSFALKKIFNSQEPLFHESSDCNYLARQIIEQSLWRVQRVNQKSACMHHARSQISQFRQNRQQPLACIPRKPGGMKLFEEFSPRREICRSKPGPAQAEKIFSSSMEGNETLDHQIQKRKKKEKRNSQQK